MQHSQAFELVIFLPPTLRKKLRLERSPLPIELETAVSQAGRRIIELEQLLRKKEGESALLKKRFGPVRLTTASMSLVRDVLLRYLHKPRATR